MKEHEIKELVEQMEQGIQSAYESMYKETSKGVFFICMSFLHNEEDAKDMMQETYLTAYKKISQLKEKEKFVPWLNQIAVNKCKESLRKNAPVLVDAQDLENAVQEDNENFLPEEYITNREKRKIVMDIMRKSLSDIQYRTVILYYFNRLTVEEIADIMECPPGTVKYRLSVARAKIRDSVLAYEKNTKDKLYSFAAVPLLASLFAMEVDAMVVPDSVWKNIKTRMDFTNNSVKTDENTSVKSMQTGGINEMVKKAGFWVGKGKIVAIIIAMVLIIGTGIGIAVSVSNKGKEADGITVNHENGEIENSETTSGENDGVFSDGSEVSEDTVQVHEVFYLQQRWLTSHDFSSGQLESAPADFVFFPETRHPFNAPYAFETIDELPDITTDLNRLVGAATKDFITWEDIRNSEGRYYDEFDIRVYNITSQDLTIQECIDNGWVAFYCDDSSDTTFLTLFGYNEEELTPTSSLGKIFTEDYLEQVLRDFGTPTYVGVGLTENSIEDTFDEMNERLENQENYVNDTNIYIDISLSGYYESAITTDGYETVTLGWEFDEYVIALTILDRTTKLEDGTYEPSPTMMYYAIYDKELWDALLEVGSFGYNENSIHRFYPEGFVMPEKTN